MSTITQEQQQKIADWLATHELPVGLGTAEAACSIAAINLSLTGELTDRIPDCMSLVLGRWIIRTQDALPHEVRNSAEWKRLLPSAAGTGRSHETERRVVILDWTWTEVLPQVQEIADARGFGEAWRDMCNVRTGVCARKARDAAFAAAAYAAAYAADYADAADYAAATACADSTYEGFRCRHGTSPDYAAADYAAAAADYAAADYAARLQFWQKADPCALLAKLIAVSEAV